MISLLKANEITQASIASLKPDFIEKIVRWHHECNAVGILPYIYEGFRSCGRQNDLYEQGRSKPGRIVTNARCGQSFHQYGRAIDWVPLVPHPKGPDMYEAGWDFEEAYEKGNQVIAVKYDLRFLTWETPHLEDSAFKDWRELSEKEPL